MTKTISIKTSELDAELACGSVSLSKQVKNMEKFYGIPNALHSVDKKFGTSTFRTVLEAAAPTLDVMVDEDSGRVQLLDPKSKFMDDNEFEQLLTIVGSPTDISTVGFQKQAIVEMDVNDKDNYLNDVFKKRLVITRKAEGGVAINTAIERQVCSNGLMIPDKQFQQVLRNPKKCSAEVLGAYLAVAGEFSVEDYLGSLFSRDGEPIMASLADVYKMQDCLINITADEDLANLLYQTERMEEFYANQGIEVSELARQYLDKLPSGLTYYQALNILTSGAKAMTEATIDNQIAVAAFCTPQKMKCLKQVKDLQFSGMPQFTNAEIHCWMGDGLKTAEAVISAVMK